MSKDGCPKCDSGMVATEEMFLVTGEVNGVRQAQIVHTCMSCGHKWAGEE